MASEVLSGAVANQALDERRHRQRRVSVLGELRLAPRRPFVLSFERDAREQFVGRCRRDSGGQLGVCLRGIELTEAEQSRRGAGEACRVLRIALDHFLVGGDGIRGAALTRIELAELQPYVGHLGIGMQQISEERRCFDRIAAAREIHGAPVALQDRQLVLRIRQRLAWFCQRSTRLRADIAERRELLTVLRGHRRRRRDCGVRNQRIEPAAHRLAYLRLFRGDRLPFRRVVRGVVQLVAGRADVAVAFVGERIQLAPPEVVARRQRLRIDAG